MSQQPRPAWTGGSEEALVPLDGNPDAGSLTNLLADEQEIIRYADIRAYTNQASTRLEVVASDDDPRITTALGEEDHRRAIALLDWLNENGHPELVRNAVAVINAVREEGLVEVGKIEDHFHGRCRAVVQVPWDPHLSAGAETQVDLLRPVTRRAYLEVAAAVADGFTA